jgi:hypothetical protein
MPCNDSQKLITYQTSPLSQGGNPVHALLGAAGQVALRNNGGTYQYNLWDGTLWHDCPNQAEWEVPIPVRGIYLRRLTGQTVETEATIEFDFVGYGPGWGNNQTMYQIKTINTLTTRQRHPYRIFKVYLTGSSSNFTELYMDA